MQMAWPGIRQSVLGRRVKEKHRKNDDDSE